ncbi:hypothetical protein [Dysgonomonas sp. ZJ279]|uniref:hypothetical protein n=1 Tax=Dysgonomonas sp. ZJ279 TaxID=2709796 RepID=UPI0013EA54FD|nr:hypothetical protein [Dysgonomonas sp. ZJ279]
MDAIIILIGFVLILTASLYWSSILSLRLPEISRFFDRKPFNCRPCLIFHFTWFLSLLFALVAWSIEIFVVGLIAAFIIFFTVKYIDNKKVVK